MKHIVGNNSRSSLSGWIPTDIQPNACDLRLGKVFKINKSTFVLSEEEKTHRGSVEIAPDNDGWFKLAVGTYEVVMFNTIYVGPNEAGWVITRSTLNRNGVFLTSGLYDTGYNGVMAAAMHVSCGTFKVRIGTRIGQYLSFESEALHNYNGAYGFGKEHDTKY